MRMKKVTPVKWRQGYALHRRRARLDGLGEVQTWYDMDTPDAVVRDGEENGICWQEVGSWQEDGRIVSGGRQEKLGERMQVTVQGALFGDLQVEVFDRFVIGGEVYELRRIQRWPSYRMLQLKSL